MDLQKFEPFPKNPAISKVFREIGLADELGSGMRNSYKYIQLYSGQNPVFEEGDIFRTIIPLKKVETKKVVESMSLEMSLTMSLESFLKKLEMRL